MQVVASRIFVKDRAVIVVKPFHALGSMTIVANICRSNSYQRPGVDCGDTLSRSELYCDCCRTLVAAMRLEGRHVVAVKLFQKLELIAIVEKVARNHR